MFPGLRSKSKKLKIQCTNKPPQAHIHSYNKTTESKREKGWKTEEGRKKESERERKGGRERNLVPIKKKPPFSGSGWSEDVE